MRNRSLRGGVFLLAVLSLGIALSGPSYSAEPEKSTATQAKYQSAETAGKAPACFGMAPNIDTVSPDKGKAGDKVTITGTNFGNSDCLRSISFGPGHAATFKVESDTRISANVPSGGRKGLAMLTVTTASGEVSKTFLVK